MKHGHREPPVSENSQLLKKHLEPALLGLLLGVLTLVGWMSDADREVARLALGADGMWPGKNTWPWAFFYHYAAWPGLIMAALALGILLSGFLVERWRGYRKPALFLPLLLLLGPGLVVNVTLKDNWGRARPSEISEFGGMQEFTPPWLPGKMGKNSSFPSGHAAVAFYVMAPWFIWRRHQKKIAVGFLGAGVVFGLLVGGARIIQGGHFLSDVLWAGGLVYIIGFYLARFCDVGGPEGQRG